MPARRRRPVRSDRGQAAILLLGLMAAVIAGALILAAFGQAYGARGRAQRGADLAAIAAAQTMREDYQRLFEPPAARPGMPGGDRMSTAQYLAAARAAAVRGGRANGVPVRPADVTFEGGDGGSFAPTRVSVVVRDDAGVRVGEGAHPRSVPVQ